VWVGSSVFGEVSLPEFLGVIVVFSVGWDVSVSESNGCSGKKSRFEQCFALQRSPHAAQSDTVNQDKLLCFIRPR